jgi:hypothetical protein
MFACDHVALLPQPRGGVLAYGLPGGTAASMSYTDQVVWPLGAVFRVLRDGPAVPEPHSPRARALHGADALFTLREAVESADSSTHAERTRLDAVSTIAGEATIGVLHTVLHAPIGALVRQHIRQLSSEARA